jgi:hypothetical protein
MPEILTAGGLAHVILLAVNGGHSASWYLVCWYTAQPLSLVVLLSAGTAMTVWAMTRTDLAGKWMLVQCLLIGTALHYTCR